jgi:hypothetical protein
VNPDETTPPVDDFLSAIQQHHWPVAVGLGIAIALYVANRANLLKNVPSKYTPTLAAVLGVISAIGAQLATGMSWEEAIGKGFLAGAAATGLWEMVLKHVLKFPVPVEATTTEVIEAPADPVAPPASESVVPAPAKKPRAKAKAAAKPESGPTAATVAEVSATDSAPVSEEPAAPKKRGRPRKNPEA